MLGENFNKLISLKNGDAIFQNHNEYVFVNCYLDIVNRVKYINENAEFDDAGFAVVQLEDGRKGLIKKDGEWSANPSHSPYKLMLN